MEHEPEPNQIAIQCCPKHWVMMETALDERGMAALISPSGEEAAKRFGDAQEQHNLTALNDPLLEAFMMMASQIMDQGVPEDMLNALGEGMLCPVCTAMALTEGHTPESTELHWTAGLADHILSVYRERGLSPKLQ